VAVPVSLSIANFSPRGMSFDRAQKQEHRIPYQSKQERSFRVVFKRIHAPANLDNIKN